MKIEAFLFELGVLFLALASVYAGIVLYRMSRIIKEKKPIWIMPLIAALMLIISLISHAYAAFVLIPSLGENIKMLGSSDLVMDPAGFEMVNTVIAGIKMQLLQLKAFSFLCFLAASVLFAFSTAVYMRWISK
ncbi:MAG TPA: hypothetical protein ENN55_06020 [Firmicutes bacterium]|nr:hypothetical protein [Bacillota bacterium]